MVFNRSKKQYQYRRNFWLWKIIIKGSAKVGNCCFIYTKVYAFAHYYKKKKKETKTLLSRWLERCQGKTFARALNWYALTRTIRKNYYRSKTLVIVAINSLPILYVCAYICMWLFMYIWVRTYNGDRWMCIFLFCFVCGRRGKNRIDFPGARIQKEINKWKITHALFFIPPFNPYPRNNHTQPVSTQLLY